MTDRTYLKDFSHKKTVSIAAAEVEFGDFDGTNTVDIIKLPENCLITAIHAVKDVAFNNSLINVKVDAAVGLGVTSNTTGVQAGHDKAISTGTGATISVHPNAVPTAGKMTVIVEFVEYTLANGQVLNY